MTKPNRNLAQPKPQQKQSVESKKPQNHVQQVISQQFHQGPLPHPEILNGYERIQKGAADRIITLAEKEAEHRHRMEQQTLQAQIDGIQLEAKEARIGQILGFLIGMTTILAGAYCAVNGAGIAGSIIGTSGVIGLVTAFIQGRKKKENQDEKAEEE